MKKYVVFIVLALLVYGYIENQDTFKSGFPTSSQDAGSILQQAWENGQSDIQVQGRGSVSKILKDDLDGSRHQRFILQLETGQSLLISHNIDLAPRINGLKSGDAVEFFGEYEWNSKGGVIHWTHHDPAGRHVGGWLKHGGRTYQ